MEPPATWPDSRAISIPRHRKTARGDARAPFRQTPQQRERSRSVLTGTYGFTGSESDLISRGLIPGGTLTPFKARLLLIAALAASATRNQIADAFSSAGLLTDSAAWPLQASTHVPEMSHAHQ